MKKTILKNDLAYLESDFFETDLGDLAQKIQDLKTQKESEGFSKIRLSVNRYDEYGFNFVLSGERLETDAEEMKRIQVSKAQKERDKVKKLKKEESERKVWEKLNRKFSKES